MYWGGVRDYKTMEGVLHENYPHRIGWQVNSFKEVHAGEERPRVHVAKEPPEPFPPRGHHFYLDRSTNDVEYKHPTGTRIHIHPNGDVDLDIRNHPAYGGGTLNIDADWDVNIKAGRDIKMVAGREISQTAGVHIVDTAPRIDHN
jgi:hypothetical protein